MLVNSQLLCGFCVVWLDDTEEESAGLDWVFVYLPEHCAANLATRFSFSTRGLPNKPSNCLI